MKDSFHLVAEVKICSLLTCECKLVYFKIFMCDEIRSIYEACLWLAKWCNLDLSAPQGHLLKGETSATACWEVVKLAQVEPDGGSSDCPQRVQWDPTPFLSHTCCEVNGSALSCAPTMVHPQHTHIRSFKVGCPPEHRPEPPDHVWQNKPLLFLSWFVSILIESKDSEVEWLSQREALCELVIHCVSSPWGTSVLGERVTTRLWWGKLGYWQILSRKRTKRSCHGKECDTEYLWQR